MLKSIAAPTALLISAFTIKLSNTVLVDPLHEVRAVLITLGLGTGVQRFIDT